MIHKQTPADFARWAALPMAHTSKVEGRIRMILDTARSRTSPRRFLLLTTVMGAAALVPLSMLQPTAKAQIAPTSAQTVGSGLVQLIGITHIISPMGFAAKPKQEKVFFKFHVTPPLQSSAVICADPDATITGLTYTSTRITEAMTSFQSQDLSNNVLYGAAFPVSLLKTTVQVGVASGPWTESVDCPKTAGKVRFQKPSGEVIFTLIPNPHHLPAAQIAQGEAVFMVSDHFRSPSPLKADNSLQAALHDGENYERAVYALDSAGRVVTKVNFQSLTLADTSRPEDYSSVKTQQSTHLPNALLKRVASFRLVARPYRWAKFKDVALQPVKP